MASAARIAIYEEPPRYPEDLKPPIQRSDSTPQEFLHPPYTAASSPSVKYEPGENYPLFSFTTSHYTPASSPPSVPAITSHSSHVTHAAAPIDSFACPAPLPQGQLPPVLASRQEYTQPTWSCPPSYETSRSPQSDMFYQRERTHFAQYALSFNHRPSPTANRPPAPYSTYTSEYAHLPVTDFYPPVGDFRYNDCRPSPHRILYPQAVYPTTGSAPYSRPVQNIVAGPERPFRCEKCGARFNRNHDLKRHTRIHLEVKPFPCGWCDKAFSRKDALKRHLIVKACSGSKEVSVEESVRRAEQMGKRKLQESSSYAMSTSLAPSQEISSRGEPRDHEPGAIFNSTTHSEYTINSCASSQSHASDKHERSPITDASFPNYLVRGRLCSVSDDSISTSGSVTTCSS